MDFFQVISILQIHKVKAKTCSLLLDALLPVNLLGQSRKQIRQEYAVLQILTWEREAMTFTLNFVYCSP